MVTQLARNRVVLKLSCLCIVRGTQFLSGNSTFNAGPCGSSKHTDCKLALQFPPWNPSRLSCCPQNADKPQPEHRPTQPGKLLSKSSLFHVLWREYRVVSHHALSSRSSLRACCGFMKPLCFNYNNTYSYRENLILEPSLKAYYNFIKYPTIK